MMHHQFPLIFQILFYIFVSAYSFKSLRNLDFSRIQKYKSGSALQLAVENSHIGGKIVITGIGENEEDEFFLNLLNEQGSWDPVVIATSDEIATKKRLLTRTAKYSGLLNILQFETLDLSNQSKIETFLENANSWIAFNVERDQLVPYSQIAANKKINRVIFTTELSPHQINETNIPEFDQALEIFKSNNLSWTGIRHGQVVSGDEDNAYEIVNATIPCLEETVERGVLGRVVAELLQIPKSSNSVCGLSSSSSFAKAYLNVLRSSGLTRREEVSKVFSGGIQRVARLTVNEYEARKLIQKENIEKAERRKLEQEKEMQIQREKMSNLSRVVDRDYRAGSSSVAVDMDIEEVEEITFEKQVKMRAEEILRIVWNEYDMRMFTKSSSKLEFYEANYEMAKDLAEKEIEAELKRKEEKERESSERTEIIDRISDASRKQYAKLLALEQKEIINQKLISDAWIKYIYFLLEFTMSYCEENQILFYNMDEYEQTKVLRTVANELRRMVKLPEYPVIYDPLDASYIINNLPADSIYYQKYNLNRNADDISIILNEKYGNLLKSLPALRGASQIIDLAIETLRKEIPAIPPSVAETKRSDSMEKQKSLSESRINAIKNRGLPSDLEEENVVGKL